MTSKVAIIGGGWAGMAAALQLHSHRIPVSLYEAARQYGGRARSVSLAGQTVDNGQHLLIGAYRETLRLIQFMGLQEEAVLLRLPLSLTVLGQHHSLRLRTPALPAPLHLAAGLLLARGIPLTERLAALRMAWQLQQIGYQLKQDISVAALLEQYHQGPGMRELFWEPLCLATLNTPMHIASAQVFLHVLRDSFSQCRSDAQMLIPTRPLGELFCDSAADFLSRHPDNQLQHSQRVDALLIEDNTLRGLVIKGETIPCQQAILATSPQEAARLLSPHPALMPIARMIRQLGFQPIVTAYLHYPPEVQLPEPMIGLHGGIAQWLTDRRHAAQPGLIAVTISTEGEHMAWDTPGLCQRLEREIATHFPDWPAPLHCRVIREKRATFACRTGCQALRPEQSTPVKGLWLAGDYTAGDYPATLEGAVRSGVQCAEYILPTRVPFA